nr:heme biosynthesis protein HemY [uncultured Gellertiella sp.]
MIRIISFAVLVLAAAWGFSWLADRPGQMMILWQGQRIEMSLMVAVSLFAAGFVLVLLVWWLLRTLWTSPRIASRYFRARKRDRGYQALSTGLIAAGAGNALLAARMAERTRGLLSADQEPLIHLLEAQTALIQGKYDSARLTFEAMAEDPETRELGLRGLYMEARRLGADEAAEHYAMQAVEKAPYLPWASQAALEYRTRAGDYEEALRLLGRQKASGSTGGQNIEREKAVLLTARAAQKLNSDPKAARDDAQAALKLAPQLVPAAIIAARTWFREDNLRRGSVLLEQVWKAEPHPEIAEAYIRARSGDTALDRLKRAEKLENLQPGNPVALAATAQAALDARLFDKARDKAEAALKSDPREGILLLLADIEEAETGDQARVRHYLSAALRAPRDPSWIADGISSPHWQPISPVSGEIGAFRWKTALDQDPHPALELDELMLPPRPAEADPVPADRMVIEHVPEAEDIAFPGPQAHAETTKAASAQAAASAAAPPPRPPEGATVVPFFGHAPDDPGVRKGAKAEPKKRKPLF